MNIYDKSYISKKAVESGFNRDTYEKVLRLVDIIEFINKDDFLNNRLALKGGTAINILEFDLPRLSVDIDLDYIINTDVDQMKSEREEINNRISKFMSQQGYSKKKNDRQSFILDSHYFTYINTGGNNDHIKFDINYVMRAHIYKIERKAILGGVFEVENGVTTLNTIEIYGSKINALNNRAAVRDLYDVWKLVKSDLLADKKEQLRKAVIFYHVLTSDEINGDFNLSAANKLNQHSILRELVPVLKKGEVFILKDALESVTNYVEELMNMTADELVFIEKFKNGEYCPDLLFKNKEIIDRISGHPMAKWKSSQMKK
jgi:predicted nucleotidyltransferase component of viral defense system